jgi:ABC-type transport system involved in multi-copper enzyme maturation permease subunit
MVNATTSLFARWKSHFTNWREWEFNPIVIKELRQGVRSWTVTGMLLLFLVVLFIASLGFLVTQSFDVSPNMGLGSSMFSTFVVILAGASVFFIPLYTGVRVAVERVEHNQDLLYVTSLSPARIIFGKFL